MTDDLGETKDFIQQAVNNAYEESIKRSFKKLNYRIMLNNKKRNQIKVKRKQERQNRKKGRS